MTFEELNLAPAIVQAVHEHGYHTPTPIQVEAVPAVLAGRDLLAGAQTGTGKTAAFTLPMLQRLSQGQRPANRFGGIGIRALVLTPTRELAAQVEESVRVYGKHVDLSSTVVFGGVGMNPQIDAMKRGVDILVATPGRLLDLQQQGFLDLSAVQILVLDEADRMLDMGFIHDVKKVLALLPQSKQSLLFSATFSDEIRDLAQGLLKDPQHIQVTPRNTTVQRITQVIHPVGRGKKKSLLVHIIQLHNWSQVLVFTRTKFGANNVADYLNKNGITAMALHGNKSQGARTQALAGFKSGEIRALVATDIAARGIDIDELPHVVNYDIPNICEDYVHRIGRTGRAGREGQAVNLVSLDEEGFMMEIERFTKQQIPVEMFAEYMPEPGEKAEPIAMGRQTLWGGAGKPPSRDVMAAAAKAARQEMVQRIREKKSSEGQGQGQGRGGRGQGDGQPRGQGQGQKAKGPRPQGNGQGGQHQGQGGGGQGHGQQRQRPPRGDRPPRAEGEEGYERQPGPNAHLGSLRIREPRPRQANPNGQPDPLRTGIDAMRTSNRFKKKNNNKKGGGGGQRGEGNVDPLRTNYGRIGNN
ncbi:MAG: DEAD/DEAH box helicase [Comamonadaceae bacterium]|jgi:ATP-dependent RNA helicase RhlE|uniref:ATP-dependent RNA helicase RhlE n=1 Tax=Hydrogenophaga borbori TaxID=2294117 RepID=A0A372EFQ6_9BURK|nr:MULTISPECIES: DEAD/DEAH box helicase [Hydrogenophaga]NCT98847.1 DEAD/DEAH box helicase [Comamonadaceae bacterium]RFP77130.1 RNA helicase [Hydrogenophaga borbori]WQB82433.1 DEAD/DEAH box helicase [Hydrogenophaga sp. SNF1]